MSDALLTLEIEKLVAGGLGLARDESGVVLVRGALPGEQVTARVRSGKGVRQGVTVEVLRRSPDRVDGPDLPTADLAHASYEAQLGFKRAFVEEALSRIAKVRHGVAATVPSPQEWGYRNTAQYLVTPQGLAYRERRGSDPLVVRADPLVMPEIQAVLDRIDPERLDPATEVAFRASRLTGEVVAAVIGAGEPKAFLRASDHLMEAGVVGVSLAQPAGRRFSAGVRLIAGEGEITEQFGEVQVRVSATGFAQVNPEAAGLAYRRATQLAGEGEHAVDLYGGAGAIGRHLAKHFRRVTVLDSSAEALARGRQDVANTGEGNVTFRNGDAARFSELGTDVIVVDPPRAGLEEAARDHIHASTADRLVYVSCDPATWARDVGDLVRRGWKLGEVVPHDFYPQTSHVEIVSVLNR
ncbi:MULTISPECIES: class I SAM-dependent RNA methyltransferase [Deinococcus]|uniref:tRNA (Uracil-5-)-methyltransferase/23S rRNA (Uracil1939-C5)-methyltransferase n=4 Tax=Deinococcus TaxID=1298 RepID=A0AAE4BNU5_9DEIO|nr:MULTISPECIES: methyltransferase domain-containing protein [Deinococcus]ALW90082.1 (uracil-5)-methyltransferase [Deinococcus actinosclerus]MDK2012839.1 methyltransferase [Deinococcus sp. 43]MDR6219922.1 tRNA (uracil-5-)-methyltransferase/23S rRNA (uracil1939-C5)-methyltransferase [Deinococcus soli (ex Cha et al. 2016)]MDR6329820.1 tRNA (uracil-5-)-methyltransferase/23S rRNA (uracil1939-C5)-methyltransferase [Deinococcus soli (ex Cha et al. 2016)]MDR6752829.1 tRNA (uracil-5-)-methyltransferas